MEFSHFHAGTRPLLMHTFIQLLFQAGFLSRADLLWQRRHDTHKDVSGFFSDPQKLFPDETQISG